MTMHHAIWKVGQNPEPLTTTTIASEQKVEDMIVAAPQIISDEWMLIGRQEITFGGRLDLLAIAPDGSLVLIEIKRDRTPREVVAQSIDYASWVAQLKSEDIAAIYARFAPGHSLSEDFQKRFKTPLDEDTLNQSHQIIIVASSIDESTTRIVAYLNERDIPINVLCFQVFANGNEQLLSRTWLLDPTETQTNAATSPDEPREPWNGEFYVSFGDDASRSWEEARQYGFTSAGGGTWYTRSLGMLKAGDRIWAKIPKVGFVGVGEVTGPRQPASSFKIMKDGKETPALEVLTKGDYCRDQVNNPDNREYFVPVRWLETVEKSKAFDAIGLFGNQNTVCKPTTPKWRYTVEQLRKAFPKATL